MIAGYVALTIIAVEFCYDADVDECNETRCAQSCTNTIGSYFCNCTEPGYVLDDDLHKCADIDECQNNNHICEELCINTPGTYHCDCHEEKELYEGNKCRCRDGYNPHSNGHDCLDINECDEIECEGANTTCLNSPGSYSCHCVEGFVSNISIDGENCVPRQTSDRITVVIAGSSMACFVLIILLTVPVVSVYR